VSTSVPVASVAAVYTAGLRDTSTPLLLRYADGRTRALPAHTWTSTSHPGDAGLLERCTGSTLDVGCGPGRLTVALAARGVPVLGVDITPDIAQLARDRGALVLGRSVFDRLPGTGRWATALLADGNLGIGGDPLTLLRRLAVLLSPQGVALVELDAPDVPGRAVRVRLEHAGQVSGWFAWAHVNPAGIGPLAARSGLTVTERWSDHRRWFVALSRPAATAAFLAETDPRCAAAVEEPTSAPAAIRSSLGSCRLSIRTRNGRRDQGIGTGRAVPGPPSAGQAGRPRQLSELAGEDPVVLQFFRGWWCPKERQFFRRLLELQADAEVAYDRFVSLSVDPPETLAAFRAGLDARRTRHLHQRQRPHRRDRRLHRRLEPALPTLRLDQIRRPTTRPLHPVKEPRSRDTSWR